MLPSHKNIYSNFQEQRIVVKTQYLNINEYKTKKLKSIWIPNGEL